MQKRVEMIMSELKRININYLKEILLWIDAENRSRLNLIVQPIKQRSNKYSYFRYSEGSMEICDH